MKTVIILVYLFLVAFFFGAIKLIQHLKRKKWERNHPEGEEE